MKTMKIKGGVEKEYHNPTFKTVEVENDITCRGDIIGWRPNPNGGEDLPIYNYYTEKQKRIITLCQTEIVEGNATVTTVGVSIMNPDDRIGDLGRSISEGRAVKNPIRNLTIVTARRLPKAIRVEQLDWAAKHVERNLNNYVNDLRETLKH